MVKRGFGENKRLIFLASCLILLLSAGFVYSNSGDVNVEGAHHPLQQVSRGSTDMTSVDSNSNTIIDEADKAHDSAMLEGKTLEQVIHHSISLALAESGNVPSNVHSFGEVSTGVKSIDVPAECGSKVCNVYIVVEE